MMRKVLLLPSLHRTNQGTEKLNGCPRSHSKKGSRNSKPESPAPGSAYSCATRLRLTKQVWCFFHWLFLIAPGDIKGFFILLLHLNKLRPRIVKQDWPRPHTSKCEAVSIPGILTTSLLLFSHFVFVFLRNNFIQWKVKLSLYRRPIKAELSCWSRMTRCLDFSPTSTCFHANPRHP